MQSTLRFTGGDPVLLATCLDDGVHLCSFDPLVLPAKSLLLYHDARPARLHPPTQNQSADGEDPSPAR